MSCPCGPRRGTVDEPFDALDVTVRKDLRRWLRRLHDEVFEATAILSVVNAHAVDKKYQMRHAKSFA